MSKNDASSKNGQYPEQKMFKTKTLDQKKLHLDTKPGV